MFHGELFCKDCGYEVPSFMWMWHHYMGFGVLVQDRKSLALRVVPIPDDEVFYSRGEQSEAEGNEASEAYVAAVVRQALGPTERRVPLSEFIRMDDQTTGAARTELPCPQC